MKTYTAIVTGLMILSLIGNYIQYRNARILSDFRTAEHLRFQDAIEKARDTAAVYADSASLERSERLKSDSIYRTATTMLRKKDARLSGIAQDQRKAVQPLIDTIQSLGEFVATLDSISETRLEIIDTLQNRIESDSASYVIEMAHKDKEIAAKDTIIGTLQDDRDYIAEKLLKAEKKAKRKENWNKVWKTTSVIAAGVAAVFILK